MTSTEQTSAEQTQSGRNTSPTSKKTASTVSRKTRENVQDKGRRLLVEGRLRVTKVDGDHVVAECRGDSGRVYELGHNNGLWTCGCPARTSCSHLIALWLVTVAG